VMATQAGFITPAQLMEAASAVLTAKAGNSLLEELERMGAITPERRALLESVASEALARSAVPDDPTLLETLNSASAPRNEPLPTGDDAPSLAPEREGQFSRLDEIGRGGQSVVFRALDHFLGREVAIKELLAGEGARPKPSDSAAGVRFLREVRLTAQLDH